MAILQLYSDLHLEFLSDYSRGRWLGQLDPGDTEVIILAGDICTTPQLNEVLTAFCASFPEVVYVTGNHEYYGSTPTEVHGLLWGLSERNKNFHWLDNQAKKVRDLLFVGGTLWFPRPDPTTLMAGKRQLNDYAKIGAFEPWVYEQNQLCRSMLKTMAPKADVVVTHHLPSVECVAPRYRRGPSSTLNHYFCDDLTEGIQEWSPNLWCFGHTHDRMAGKVGGTTLVCNALGYPQERESKERGSFASICRMRVSPGVSGVEFPNDVPGPGFPNRR